MFLLIGRLPDALVVQPQHECWEGHQRQQEQAVELLPQMAQYAV